nr:transducin beta-like protein 3 [Tanacetum cinerariifolium]
MRMGFEKTCCDVLTYVGTKTIRKGFSAKILVFRWVRIWLVGQGAYLHTIILAEPLFQVRVYVLALMSCSYVLARFADIVLYLDTCTRSYARTLIVMGSKDNTVGVIVECKQLKLR